MFQNPDIPLDDLPATDKVQWERLYPRYVRAIRVASAAILVVIAITIAVLGYALNIPLVPVAVLYLALLIAAVITMIWPGIAVQRRGYVLRDKDILFRKGVIWHSVTAIPFNRIQHVETSSTPLERRFDLGTLQLFTAGGSGGDLKIGGLGRDVAEKLRVFVLNKAGSAIEHS
ncbi:MAG: PH domain-containing protein [Woeseia sp.]